MNMFKLARLNVVTKHRSKKLETYKTFRTGAQKSIFG